eukprot:29337-Pelagococcus_subviridis.AAC.11
MHNTTWPGHFTIQSVRFDVAYASEDFTHTSATVSRCAASHSMSHFSTFPPAFFGLKLFLNLTRSPSSDNIAEVDRFEDFLQKRLHAQRVLRLRENLEELVVGEEIKTRKREAFRFQVLRQPLVHLVEQPVGFVQRREELLVAADDDNLRGDFELEHRLPPRRVHGFELSPLGRHLRHDVVRPEDGLEVQPSVLTLQPRVHDLLYRVDLRLPQLHAVFERTDVRRRAHRLRLHDLVVEKHLRLVQALEDRAARLSPRRGLEHDTGPVALHLIQRPLERVLLARVLGDAFDDLEVRGEIQLQRARDAKVLIRLHREANLLADRRPVTVAETGVAHRRDERHALAELLDLPLERLAHGKRRALQVFDDFQERSVPIVDLVRHLLRVERRERPRHPLRDRVREVAAQRPHRLVRLERFRDHDELWIVRLRKLEEFFPRRVQRRLRAESFQDVVDVLRFDHAVLDVIEVARAHELVHLDPDLVRVVGELPLIVLQLLLERLLPLLYLFVRPGEKLEHHRWPHHRGPVRLDAVVRQHVTVRFEHVVHLPADDRLFSDLRHLLVRVDAKLHERVELGQERRSATERGVDERRLDRLAVRADHAERHERLRVSVHGHRERGEALHLRVDLGERELFLLLRRGGGGVVVVALVVLFLLDDGLRRRRRGGGFAFGRGHGVRRGRGVALGGLLRAGFGFGSGALRGRRRLRRRLRARLALLDSFRLRLRLRLRLLHELLELLVRLRELPRSFEILRDDVSNNLSSLFDRRLVVRGRRHRLRRRRVVVQLPAVLRELVSDVGDASDGGERVVEQREDDVMDRLQRRIERGRAVADDEVHPQKREVVVDDGGDGGVAAFEPRPKVAEPGHAVEHHRANLVLDRQRYLADEPRHRSLARRRARRPRVAVLLRNGLVEHERLVLQILQRAHRLRHHARLERVLARLEVVPLVLLVRLQRHRRAEFTQRRARGVVRVD